MKRARIFVLLALAVSCAPAGPRGALMPAPASAASPRVAGSDDPTTTDPDKYKVVFENERMRVLRYHDQPGSKTAMHRHPDSMLYALSNFRRRLTFPDGTSRVVELKAGDTMWVPAQEHIGENVGSTECEVLLVEPKR